MAAEEKEIADKTARLGRKLMRAMLPPDDLTVSEWAAQNRRLSAEASAEEGRWRNERTPYLVTVMDAFTDPNVRHIVMVAASQVGKSEAINNIIGYIIDEDPGSILFVQPTTVDAKEYSKLRIAPLIRDCPVLRNKVADAKARDSANTILQKSYPGGILTLTGSTEAHALASKPIRYVLGDEIDRWSITSEGSAWELAMARQTTFYNAKSVQVSTPTVKGASEIAAAYSLGTMERWCTQCPDCGKWIETKWCDIRFEHEEYTVAGIRHFRVNNVYHVCPECGAVHDEYTLKHQPSKWVSQNPEGFKGNKITRSFWLNAFCSQWKSWEEIVLQFLQAQGSSAKMQVVYNTAFGELWEHREDVEGADELMARREDYRAELPDGVLVLTCGIDTQDDRLEYEIVGHGYFGETWGIRKGVILGKPDSDETWTELDNVLSKTYSYGNGVGLRISMAFMDEGGHYTAEVRQRCRERQPNKLFCIKGFSGEDKPFTSPPKKVKILVRNKAIGACWQYQLGVDSGKQMIMDALRVQTPGNKYCHFPQRDDYDSRYFDSLLSERLVYHEGRAHPWGWEKIPGHERNEALDCRNYAMAAFRVLNCNLDEIKNKLRETAEQMARRAVVEEPEEKPQASVPIVQKPQSKQAAPKYVKKKRLSDMMDSW